MLGRRCCSAEHRHTIASRMNLSHRNKRNPRNQQGTLSSPSTEKWQLEVLRGPSCCGSEDIGVPPTCLGWVRCRGWA